ncbi:MAG TPA: amidohydrolase family protein [Candidatus Marinimicrobia bacterium]|nr:amidohydrolase family protein [Candidatus Neomarinimicrobiota bacterium]
MMIKIMAFKQQLINLLRIGFLFFIIFHTLIAQPLAIKGGRIITISGSVIEKGTILIDGGIIRDVGLNIKIPKDAEIIDARGQIIMPGLIDAMTYYGIDSKDLNESIKPISPELRIIESYYPFGKFGDGSGEIKANDLLSGGITTIYIAPGDATILGGQGAIVQTAAFSFDEMIVKAPAAIDMTFGSKPGKINREENRTPVTKMAAISQLRETLIKAQEYQKNNKVRDLGMEALGQLLEKKIPARIQANSPGDIRSAINLANEFKFDLIIDGGASSDTYINEIAKGNIPIILGPVSHPYISGEEIPDYLEYPSIDEGLAGRLEKAGINIAFGSFSYGLGSLAKGITGKWLLIDAAISTGYGMSEQAVLRSLTLGAAEILGIEDKFGSLEKGKQADIILLDGDPLSIRTWVQKVYISGRLVYSK